KFELDVDQLNNPIVLIGWPGIALVAQLAIGSIKDSIKADLFMEIEFFDFPPKSTVEDGIMEIPSAKVYYKSRKINDLFILTANFQPQNPEGVFEFTKRFCEEMDKITGGKIKMFVSTGALVSDKVSKEPKVHVCSTDKSLISSFLDFENTTVMEGGIIAGANGILPAWAGTKGFAPGVCLLAETIPLPMMSLDPRASKALVLILKNYFKIDISFDELDKKIEEMQSVFDSFKKQADYFMKGGQEDKGPDSYFR
ncbi:MAG: PAC2 family protein, partial [Candidatus Hermodarchaeota archaeon]